MKVFLSWSGVRSREVADALKDWISCVIQAVKPWVSTQDIDRGAIWFSEIGAQLQDTAVGVICLTKENKERPWILFEAGALAKGLTTSRVCTFLIDLQPADVREPLSQFNHTFPAKDSMLALLRTLNAALGDRALDPKILDQVFDTYYPQFDDRFRQILVNTPDAAAEPPKAPEDALNEILSVTKGLANRMSRVEVLIGQQAEQQLAFGELSFSGAPMDFGISPNSSMLRNKVLNMRIDGKSRDEALLAIKNQVSPRVAKRIIDDMYGDS